MNYQEQVKQKEGQTDGKGGVVLLERRRFL